VVYALRDPDSSEVRYVGLTTMAIGVRVRGHLREVRRGSQLPSHKWMRQLQERGYASPEAEVLEECDTLGELCDAEILWIAKLGGVLGTPGTRLLNVSYGGDLAPSLNPAVAAKISEKMLGEGHPNRGRHLTEAHRRAIGDAQRGDKNHNYGKTGVWAGRKHSLETKAKISEKMSGENSPNRGRAVTPETRKKISGSLSGEKHWNYGKTATPETREKMAKSQRERRERENLVRRTLS